MENFEEKLINTIKAGAIIIQIVSFETHRVHAIVNKTAKILQRKWYTWNRIEGLKEWAGKGAFKTPDEDKRSPEDVLNFFKESEEDIILILENFHPDLREDQVATIQRLRNIAQMANQNCKKTLILTQPSEHLPCDLEKEIQVMDLPLPNLEDLEVIVDRVCKNYELSSKNVEKSQKILEAALGLTIMEAQIAFSKAVVIAKQLTEDQIPIVIAEKENIIKKSGFLEYFHPQENLQDVGGLDVLKEWLERRGKAFKKGAKDYGLEYPKGVLLLGLPGTGKSLLAKAIANAWQFPLLRLDMGKIFGGIVGQSESNIRASLKVAEAISPCILWIDEIEKGMAGLQSSGASDGGTTSRVLGTFLTWMQEKSKPVFVVATANKIDQLPPELLRKGRVDEIFFVDLPSKNARAEIFKIHLKKKKRDPKNFDLEHLAEMSQGFSGAEIEEAIKEAMFYAFYRDDEVTNQDIIESLEKTYPLSRTMAEMIQSLRRWAKTRAIYAAREESEEIDSKDKSIPKLKQEYSNPFISDVD